MALSAEELRQKIEAAEDNELEPCEVPEWGISKEDGLMVRGLTATERDRYEMGMFEAQKNPAKFEVRAGLVAKCLVDESGKRLYTDKQIGVLGKKNAIPVDRLFDVIRVKSGITEAAVEDAAEDFGVTQAGGSPSD